MRDQQQCDPDPGSRTVDHTEQAQMGAFDKLPKRIKHFMNYCRVDWSAQNILDRLKLGETEQAVMDDLAREDDTWKVSDADRGD